MRRRRRKANRNASRRNPAAVICIGIIGIWDGMVRLMRYCEVLLDLPIAIPIPALAPLLRPLHSTPLLWRICKYERINRMDMDRDKR